MTDGSSLRASDADRERVVGLLGEHMAQGRLTLAEFEERAAQAYAAKTYADLEPLTADLPVEPVQPPARPNQRAEPAERDDDDEPASPRRSAREALGVLTPGVVCTGIWGASVLSSGQLEPFWPAWVLVPLGAIGFARWVSGRT